MNENIILIVDIDKKKDITSRVHKIEPSGLNYKITFKNKTYKSYTYPFHKIEIIHNPTKIENDIVIRTRNSALNNVKKILKFNSYIKVFFENGTSKMYLESEISIENNLLKGVNNKNIFYYLKEMASILTVNDLNNDEEDISKKEIKILEKIYEKMDFVNENSVLKNYFSAKEEINKDLKKDNFLYPFSFNGSQQTAIYNAFNNRISVIEGPPGTGKTQTILNIISNIIINNQNVAILSNNNSATKNVYDKLKKQGLEGIVASLGKKDNIDSFLASQTKRNYSYDWMLTKNQKQIVINNINELSPKINKYLKDKNDKAKIAQELRQLKLEFEYFKEQEKSFNLEKIDLGNINEFNADKLHRLLLFLNKKEYKTEYLSNYRKILTQLKFKFKDFDFLENEINKILQSLEYAYYVKKIDELESSSKQLETIIENIDDEFKKFTELSMKILKSYIYENYNKNDIYNEKTIKNTNKLIKDYPVILSTTYSLLNCVSPNFLFDYMIIDESSQVDLVSAFPALSLAKNLIIVGDSKQLPNIIDGNRKDEFDSIFYKYEIDERYNYTKNSLLSLTKNLYKGMPSKTLVEHYRCNPQIIDFCNKKFYNNELVILSESKNDNPIKQYKSVKGNHARRDENGSQINDRQATIIIDEIIPNENIDIENSSIGIITPYKGQKKYLIDKINNKNVQIDTVHGFQGRENDIIIFSTVANNITKFLDNPNSINVAVSRAIDKLYLVTPYEYESADNSNIGNLISYISYNNFEVVQSKVSSIFDLLYKVNENDRIKFLSSHMPYSIYPSETIMYHTIKKVLTEDKYSTYGVSEKHYPLRKIVKDRSILNEEELKFIKTNSHIDFIIFNKFDNKPILAIEVDGYKFHISKKQQIRDNIKNNILDKCNVPYIRFKTNEAKEREILIKKLDEIIKTNV